MAKTRNRHNAAFVVGSGLGGVAGAAIALWKTPYSGVELRERITGGTSTTTGSGATVTAPGMGAGATGTEPRFSSKLLSSVENTLAPVVGVKLGKTANEGPVTTAPWSVIGNRPSSLAFGASRTGIQRPRFMRGTASGASPRRRA